MSLQVHNKKDSFTEDTFTRLLRLGRGLNGQAYQRSFSHRELMEESAGALNKAARSEGSEWAVVAARITESPVSYQLWESEHSQLMAKLAHQPHRARQSIATLSASFMLLHRRSLFDYLRQQRVTRPVRRNLIAHFHGEHSYVKAMLQEHANYLRSSASLLCIRHLGQEVFRHAAFGIPLTEYEWQYSEYFNLYCEWALAGTGNPDLPELRAEMAQLKAEVLRARKRLLAMPAAVKR